MAYKKRNLSSFMLLVGLLPIVMLFSGCETKPAGESKQIVVYNSPPEWANWGEMLKRFSAKTCIRRFSQGMKGKPSRPGRSRSFGMSRRACLRSGDRVLTFPRPRENSARFAICN